MFFGRKDPAEQMEHERQAKKDAASIAALTGGGLPPDAVERLTSQTLSSGDLSASELLLARECGGEQLGLVMGSSFYAIRYRALYSTWTRLSSGELKALSEALRSARMLALERLQQEAALLGAHGVIGVRLTLRNHSWSSGQVEFTAIGTAIRIAGLPDTAKPFTSDLSGQEFWKLYQAGYMPSGLVLGVCSYYVSCDYKTAATLSMAWGAGWKNQEIGIYTSGFTFARHTAMARFKEDIKRVGGEGAVGMHIDYHLEEYEYESGQRTFIDLIINFVALGTAIVGNPHHDEKRSQKTLTMLDLATGRSEKIEVKPPAPASH